MTEYGELVSVQEAVFTLIRQIPDPVFVQVRKLEFLVIEVPHIGF